MYKNGKPTSAGHVGIVVDVTSDGTLVTIEGNTSSEESVQREGDGVWLKRRRNLNDPRGQMQVKGFLKIW